MYHQRMARGTFYPFIATFNVVACPRNKFLRYVLAALNINVGYGRYKRSFPHEPFFHPLLKLL